MMLNILFSIRFFIGCIAWTTQNFECFAKEVRDAFDESPRENVKWQQTEGLTIPITNALDPVYNSYFYTAIRNWEAASQYGAKNSVRFVVSTMPPSSIDISLTNCREGVYGETIICSHNYEATAWASLQINISEDDYIVKSIIKVNDYYMKHASDKYKQYALCHEIGLSLGLKTSFSANNSTGSCLDHDHFESSQQPDRNDYDKLTEIYGLLRHAPRQSALLVEAPPNARAASSKLRIRRTSNNEIAPCCSYNEKICGTMESSCDSDKITCEETCAGYWLDGSTWQDRSNSNCTGLSDMCRNDADCCGRSVCKVDIYRGHSVCVQGSPTKNPSVSPSSAPSKAPSAKPTRRPVTTAPTASPLATARPTLSSCCSHNNKICGYMVDFCDVSKRKCEEKCGGFWLNSKARQDRANSNCVGISDSCATDSDCCGNSICKQDPYVGYNICATGPPTKNPTISPSSKPSETGTNQPTNQPSVTLTAAPSVSPCCSFNNKMCGGMEALCDSNKNTCESTCGGFWLDGETQKTRAESNCVGLSDTCTFDAECCGDSLCKQYNAAGHRVCVLGQPTVQLESPSLANAVTTTMPVSPPTKNKGSVAKHDRDQVIDCSCPQTCTDDILSSYFGLHTCKSYIKYQMQVNNLSELYACVLVSQAANPACGGGSCNPYKCPNGKLRHLKEIQAPPALAADSKQLRIFPHFNITKLEMEMGYERKTWGDLVQIRNKSLRYGLSFANGTTRFTDVSLLLPVQL